MTSVVIVGSSAAGLTVAEGLRMGGLHDRITLIDKDRHAWDPYDRPPLSKQLLSGAWSEPQLRLRPPEVIEQLGVQFVPERATAVHRDGQYVQLEHGSVVPYNALVVATGLTPRIPPAWSGLSGVHVLHTLDHGLALRAALTEARHVVIVGAGVLGCEIAATARSLGCNVCLVDELGAPMSQSLGSQIGRLVQTLHTLNGVRVVTHTRVTEIIEAADGRVGAVRVAGETVPADVIVVAIGGTPEVGWLRNADGLIIDDGLVCDSRCRAAPGIFAAGDAARWYHEGLRQSIRLENRTNATEQALAVAANILGADEPYCPTPYFWSDQFGVRLQVLGQVHTSSRIEFLEGEPDGRRFLAVAKTGERVDAVIGWGHPRGVVAARALVTPRYARKATPTSTGA